MSDRENMKRPLDELEEILAEFQMKVGDASAHPWDLFGQRVIAWSNKVANEFGEDTRRAVEVEIGECLTLYRLPPGGFTEFQQRAVRARRILQEKIRVAPSPTGLASAQGARCRFGIVTALPKEFAAMRAMLDEAQEHAVDGDPNNYAIGSIPACDGSGEHRVVVTLLKKAGNNTAAAAAVNLLRSFPVVEDVLMVGIAGGIPYPSEPDRHVRLGDIVVSNEYGVLQYDNIKLVQGIVKVRSTSSPPSAALVGRTRILEAGRLAGRRPWEESIRRASRLEGVARPDSTTDRLYSTDDPTVQIRHPRDPNRRAGKPKVHYGRIGSANILLRDSKRRDALRDEYAARAIEMEGAGIADGTWEFGQSYMLIRGISDYGDCQKNDKWQGYAAVVAAAYARALIESFPAKVDPAKAQAVADTQKKLDEARAKIGGADFDAAAQLFEEAALLAQAAGEQQMERAARLNAARALVQRFHVSNVEEPTRTQLLAQIQEHIDTADKLGARPARVATERALLARLYEQPAEVIRWAEAATAAAEGDPSIEADAMLARLQALWHFGRNEDGLAFAEEVERLRTLVDGDERLVLDATWLRTPCKAGRASGERVQSFANEVRSLVNRAVVARKRAAMVLGEVANEFNRSDCADHTHALCQLAYEIAEPLGHARMSTTIALQIAELAAVSGDAAEARLYLGRAESWAEQYNPGDFGETEESRAVLRANVLFARGRVLARLGWAHEDEGACDEKTLNDAHDALTQAKSLASTNRETLGAGVELYLADVSSWLGRVAQALGNPEEAASLFRAVRSDAAMAHPRFAVEAGMDCWLREAESLRLAGRPHDARALIDDLLADPRVPDSVGTRTRAFREYLDHRELPVLDWLASDDAAAIARAAVETSLHSAIAQQLAPLVSWWREWHKEKSGPESEFLDFWGRGGFARVAAAVRAKPHSAIAVDACSTAEIRKWTRVLCPLFDTVLVKWKGDIGAGLVMVPMHEEYGGPGSFGGWGYMVTAGTVFRGREDWTVAMGWANPLPREITAFLASEALPLVRAGRLVVLPAPLVGCTQSAVGWTDDLLLTNFLGGVVNVGKRDNPAGAIGKGRRILDLSSVSIPFIENVSLADLARVLDEAAEWVHPLKALLLKSISSDDLKWERWENIRSIENDIQDACRVLREKLASLGRRRKRDKWKVAEVGGTLSAGARASGSRGHDAVTDLLRTLSPLPREVAPWVPYWLLENMGGHLDWTCPLDNRSKPPDEPTTQELPLKARAREVQSWIYPGTGGWVIPSVGARISV
jgi:nucleoside phosphorylase